MIRTLRRAALALLLSSSGALAGFQIPVEGPDGPAQDEEARDPRPEGGFARVVPASSLAFVGVDDTRVFAREFGASCMGGLWADPELGPLRVQIDAELATLRDGLVADLGVDPFSLAGMLDGSVGLVVLEAPTPDADDDGESQAFAMALLLEFGTRWEEAAAIVDVLFERIHTKAEGEPVRSVGLVDGTEVASILWPKPEHGGRPEIELRHGFHDGTLLVVFSVGESRRDPFVRLLEGLDGEEGDRLSTARAWTGSSAAAPRALMRMWADVGGYVGAVVDELAASPEAGSGLGLVENLGLRGLGVLSAYSGTDGGGSVAEVTLDWQGDGWIPRLLRLANSGAEPKTLGAIPAECRSASVWTMQPVDLYDEVVGVLLEAGVLDAGSYVEAIGAFEQEAGFSPRDDLLEALDGEFAIVMDEVAPAEAMPFIQSAEPLNAVLLVGLQDGATLARLIDDFVRGKGLHAARKSTDFLGYTVHYLPLFPSVALSYAILDDLLVLSLSPTLVQDVLRRKANPDLPSLGTNPAFAAARKRNQAGGMLSWSDTAAEMRGAFLALRTLPGVIAESAKRPGQKTELPAPLRRMSEVLSRLGSIPVPDLAIMKRHFPGGTLTVVRVDESGILMRSVGP